ncbi:MAG: N-succinylglutamate 5-semialdehyde dehydrogenase [Chlamydiales bacterium]|nr:N-succinylglutamate 5-semialdehyde dehydrogenase [Chlamydiales bacterium]
MRESHFISGSWVEGIGEPFHSLNPATQLTLWEGRQATPDEVDEAVSAAREAFPKWSAYSFEKRLSLLKEYEKALKENSSQLVEAICQETGKPRWESTQEVSAMIGKIAVSVEAYHERCPDQALTPTLHTRHKPHGVVAVFGPFNFPGHLPNGHIVPALLAGNTVVFKSSPYTPLVAEIMIQCFASFPPGVINLIQGKGDTGHSLAIHPQIDGLFFTGSHKTGMVLTETLHRHPEKILALEMGGNSPLIVNETNDLEGAAYLTIQSAYLTAGQRCSCARRLIVERDKEGDEFLKILAHMISSIQVGPYTDQPEPFMGPVIDLKAAEKLLNAQATYGAEGGHCLVEMTPLKEGLPFLTPGLMDVTDVSHLVDEELFGPFLRVTRVSSFEDAIHEANQTKYGLAAGLISSNPEKYRHFYREVRAGVINWNHPTTGASSRAPFGGLGNSGNFRPGGYYAADYCSYPVASMEQETLHIPKQITPGISFLAKS